MSIKPPPSSSPLPSASDGGDDTVPESEDRRGSSSTETRLQQHEKPTLQEPPAKRAGVVPEDLGELMDNMQKHFRCLFQYHSLAIGSSLDPLLNNTKEQQPTLDLSFLEPLKIKDSLLREIFFPDHNTLYVRKCMRDIFQLFCEDVNKERFPREGETVLIGSPGVGKSLLFFSRCFVHGSKIASASSNTCHLLSTDDNSRRRRLGFHHDSQRKDRRRACFVHQELVGI
jgi:hypothetical protein